MAHGGVIIDPPSSLILHDVALLLTDIRHVRRADGTPCRCEGRWLVEKNGAGLKGCCSGCGEERHELGSDEGRALDALTAEICSPDAGSPFFGTHPTDALERPFAQLERLMRRVLNGNAAKSRD
jgi:hypothetical protein